MTTKDSLNSAQAQPPKSGLSAAFTLVLGDRFALVSLIYLVLLVTAATIGPELLGDAGTKINLRMRNVPTMTMENGFLYLLGGDSLGRPILPMLLVGARTTLMIAVSVVIFSMLIGTTLGVVAGYYERLLGAFIMRAADVIMSFPSLLLAVIVLYVLEPAAANVVIVLAITRLPIYIRVARAEVLEIRERLFVESARASGASNIRIMVLHILPVVVPTIFTVATLDFAGVMLSESGLSFLGIGVQPPDVTWGLMVAMGRNFLTTAWWLAFWPGLAILLTALATNLLSNWLRLAMDPMLRWRLEDTDAVEERRDV
ncbi:MAG: ABC transporter permease [Rhodospirillales bacterium]